MVLLAEGVKVAVRVKPLPLIADKVPPLTVMSPVLPSQLKLEPGSSLKVKVMVALSPALRVLTSLLMVMVGGMESESGSRKVGFRVLVLVSAPGSLRMKVNAGETPLPS